MAKLTKTTVDAAAPVPQKAQTLIYDDTLKGFGLRITLGGVKSYYVNTYHTASYVRSHWRRNMTLVDIVQFLGTHHDTVVLRRT